MCRVHVLMGATRQVFELLTAEYLFDPHGQGELFTKDDDHMAQIIELMGDFPLDAKMGGKYSRELFDHTGTPSLLHAHTFSSHPPVNRCLEVHPHAETMAPQTCHDGKVSLRRGRRDGAVRVPRTYADRRHARAEEGVGHD
jgi:hypothetical protein